MEENRKRKSIRSAVALCLLLSGIVSITFGYWASRPAAIPELAAFFFTRLFYSLNEPYGINGVYEALRANALFIPMGVFFIALSISIVAGLADRFKDATAPKKYFSDGFYIASITILWAITYLPLLSKIKMGGDACAYSMHIRDMNLVAYLVHWGVVALGIVWNAVVPLPLDVNFNLFGMLMGLGNAILTFVMARRYTRHAVSAAVAALVLLWSPNFWFHSVLFKSYTSEMFFLMLAYWLWINDKPEFAGFSFLIAVLITPLSVVGAPGFILGEIKTKKILRAAAASLPFYLLFQWYYWGRFFSQMFNLGGAAADLTFIGQLPPNLRLLAVNFNFALVPIALGILYCRKNLKSVGRQFVAASVLGFITMVFIQGRWVEFSSIIIFFFFIAAFAGMGIDWILENKTIAKYFSDFEMKAAIAALIILFGVTGFNRVYPEYKMRENFGKLSKELYPRMADGAVVIGDWERIRQFEYYNTAKIDTGFTFDFVALRIEWEKMDEKTRPDFFDLLTRNLAGYREVWVMETGVKKTIEADAPLEEVNLPSGKVWRWKINREN